MASLALASLMEAYTDSEGEETVSIDRNSEETPICSDDSETLKPKGPSNIVPYHFEIDEITDDEDFHDETTSTDTSTTPDHPAPAETPVDPKLQDVVLPPEPTGPCSQDLQDKIAEMTRMMEIDGRDMNQIIQQRKSFRNPNTYEKLISYCNINEYGTNFHPRVYDPLKWGKNSYYDELAKIQDADMERREKKRQERAKIEIITGTAKTVTLKAEDSKKKKSKWNQAVLPQAGTCLQPSLSSLPVATSSVPSLGSASRRRKRKH